MPDNAVAEIADDEVEKYRVVRIADEIVVDLLKEACGVNYEHAAVDGIEIRTINGISIPVATKELLIKTKQTVRPRRGWRCAVLTLELLLTDKRRTPTGSDIAFVVVKLFGTGGHA